MSLRDDLQALMGVQTVDTQILHAQAAVAALDTGARLAAAHNAAKTEAERLRAAALKAQAAQHDAEMRLQSIETKSDQVQKSLFSGKVTGPRELENLQKEQEMLKRQRGDAETQVLEAMDITGERVSAADAAETEMNAIALQYRAVRAVYKERHATLSAEIAAHEKERVEAAKPIPAALLARYDAIRTKKNGVAAAFLEADISCGACHTRLNTHLTDATLAGEVVQLCEYCGRILVPAAPRA